MTEDEAYAMCDAYEQSEREFADLAHKYEQERDELSTRIDDLRVMLWEVFGIAVSWDEDGGGWRVAAVRNDVRTQQHVHELERENRMLKAISKQLVECGNYKCTLTYCGDCGYEESLGCGLADIEDEMRELGIEVY